MKLKADQLRSMAGGTYGPGGDDSSSSYMSNNGSVYQEELKVPNALVGLIIGRGGESIQKLQMQTGATLQIAKEHEM